MAEPRFDTWSLVVGRWSLVVGMLALVGATLVLLDRSGTVHVDAAAAAASLLVALGVAGVVRAALSLRLAGGPSADS